MDHGHRALAPGQRQHVENLPVVQAQALVGHVDLEGGVALAHQRRQLLAQHLGVGVRQDQMEAVVDVSLAVGACVIVLDRFPQAHVLLL